MIFTRIHNISSLAIAIVGLPCVLSAEVDFAHDVVPILKESCVKCHGGEKSKGGFSLNTREMFLEADVVKVGDPDNSLFIELLRAEFEDERMPPEEDGYDQLPDEQVKILRQWVSEGLKWEPGFTFGEPRYEAPLKPRKPELPDGPVAANPIDLILDKYLQENQIDPPGAIDDAGYLRRVSLDLIGLPPTPEELETFLADKSPDKRTKVVKSLLARDVDYADHWLTFWNDLLRNAYDGTGFITGGRKRITKWLYGSLYSNKPYDQFVREVVAPGKDAQGFIDGIKWRGEVNASQTTAIQFSQNVSQVFLGINMKCASCHDSFIDQWKLRDAYSLAAIYSDQPLELTRCDKPTGEKAEAGWIFPEIGSIDPKAPRNNRLKQLADLMVHPENGRTDRTIVNRLWKQLMGHGIVDPVDAMDTEPWNADLLDYLAVRLVEEDYNIKAILELIATSQAYQQRSAIIDEETGAFTFRGPVMKRMTAEQFIDSVRQVTNNWPTELPANLDKKQKQASPLKDIATAMGEKQWNKRPIRAALFGLDAFQAALGRPNRDQVVSERPDTLSTLEAIHLANGPEFASMLREGAEALLATKQSPDKLVDQVYLSALSREPTVAERSVGISMLCENPPEDAMADFLWTVFVQPEFFYIR